MGNVCVEMDIRKLVKDCAVWAIISNVQKRMFAATNLCVLNTMLASLHGSQDVSAPILNYNSMTAMHVKELWVAIVRKKLDASNMPVVFTVTQTDAATGTKKDTIFAIVSKDMWNMTK